MIEHVSTPTARIAYRRIGDGPPLVLLHGWPFDGRTFEALIGRLADRFTCVALDTPGLGATEWTPATDFAFDGQAATLARAVDALGVDRYALLGHDTGGTIARRLAALHGERVTRLVLMDTEMPGHRPPWIPLFQRLAALPGAALGFATLLRSRAFVRSSLGFGGCFHDPARLDDPFVARWATPLVRSRAKLDGALRYLRAIDWGLVDALPETHRRIRCDVRLVWGARDPIFPVERARALPPQFGGRATLVEVPDAAFLVHEERPDAVVRAVTAA